MSTDILVGRKGEKIFKSLGLDAVIVSWQSEQNKYFQAERINMIKKP